MGGEAGEEAPMEPPRLETDLIRGQVWTGRLGKI